MPPVITIENLGKRYSLRHMAGNQPYVALRDVISDAVKNFGATLSGKGPRPEGASQQEDFWALQNVSFQVEQGSRLGIIGRNGAGKSTLLKVLSRITEPTTGSVRIKGRIASLLEVGTGFHPELTGRENIYLNGAILGMGRAEIRSKFDRIVDFAEIDKFLDTPVKRYSSGMYVRLAFAVAAHVEPDILVVDEVLAVGDARFQKKCLGKMEDVSAKEGRTVLFVSHNMSAIRSLCDRALLLEQGRLVAMGSPVSTIDRYLAGINDASSCDMPLQSIRRHDSLGNKIRLNRVRFNNGSDIRHGMPLSVEIGFTCLSDADEVSFGIGICNRDGARIMTIDSDLQGARNRYVQGQQGTASFTLPALFLEPDTYSLDIGSRSGDNFGLDYLPQCGLITVLPGESTPPFIALRDSGQGGLRCPAEWNISIASPRA